jgi:type IV pilus assembly protein PilX
MMTQPQRRPANNVGISCQSGSVLLVSLIMLLLITLVAVGGMQGTILQERMTTNMRDRELAFQAAEAAVRDAESFLTEEGPALAITNTNGVYEVGNNNRPEWDTTNIDNGNGAQEYRSTFEGVSAQPVYYVEQLPPFWGQSLTPPFEPSPFFRITARGFGGSSNTSVVVSSVYKAWQ